MKARQRLTELEYEIRNEAQNERARLESLSRSNPERDVRVVRVTKLERWATIISESLALLE
jgi:hypothetical protein